MIIHIFLERRLISSRRLIMTNMTETTKNTETTKKENNKKVSQAVFRKMTELAGVVYDADLNTDTSLVCQAVYDECRDLSVSMDTVKVAVGTARKNSFKNYVKNMLLDGVEESVVLTWLTDGYGDKAAGIFTQVKGWYEKEKAAKDAVQKLVDTNPEEVFRKMDTEGLKDLAFKIIGDNKLETSNYYVVGLLREVRHANWQKKVTENEKREKTFSAGLTAAKNYFKKNKNDYRNPAVIVESGDFKAVGLSKKAAVKVLWDARKALNIDEHLNNMAEKNFLNKKTDDFTTILEDIFPSALKKEKK